MIAVASRECREKKAACGLGTNLGNVLLIVIEAHRLRSIKVRDVSGGKIILCCLQQVSDSSETSRQAEVAGEAGAQQTYETED
jgi:hypothetical protein